MNGKLIPKIIAQYKKIALIQKQREAHREKIKFMCERDYFKREKLEQHPELLAIKMKVEEVRRPFAELSRRQNEIESLLSNFENSLETKSGPELQYSDLLLELYAVSTKMRNLSSQENPARELEKQWSELRSKLSEGIDDEYWKLRNIESTLELDYNRELGILSALKAKFLNS